MDFFYTSFIAILLLAFSILMKRFYGRNTNNLLPPGTFGWPLVGQTFKFLSTGWDGHPEKFLFDNIHKYHSLIFKSHLIGHPMIVFCGAAANKFIFSNEERCVRVWFPDAIKKIFPVSTLSKDDTINLRKRLVGFLRPEALQRFISVMDVIAQRHFADHWDNKEQVSVFHLAGKYTFTLACRLFISIEDPKHIAMFEEKVEDFVRGVMSIPINLPGTPLNRAIKSTNFIKKEIISIIKQRKIDQEKATDSPKQDMLSNLLLTCDENGTFMKENQIADHVLGMLIGGHDTARSASSSIIKFLSELPEVYEKVYKEQMEIANSKGPDELLTWNDINKMKYSWNVACEAMRLAPPVQGAFREVLTDFVYDGFSIQKGWKIYWDANSTHKSAEYFPEPTKFDASRFAGEGPQPYTFVPFGGGPRMCPGKEYARLEILVFMHNLVKRFRWEMVFPNEKLIVNPLFKPENGLPIRIYPFQNT